MRRRASSFAASAAVGAFSKPPALFDSAISASTVNAHVHWPFFIAVKTSTMRPLYSNRSIDFWCWYLEDVRQSVYQSIAPRNIEMRHNSSVFMRSRQQPSGMSALAAPTGEPIYEPPCPSSSKRKRDCGSPLRCISPMGCNLRLCNLRPAKNRRFRCVPSCVPPVLALTTTLTTSALTPVSVATWLAT